MYVHKFDFILEIIFYIHIHIYHFLPDSLLTGLFTHRTLYSPDFLPDSFGFRQ